MSTKPLFTPTPLAVLICAACAFPVAANAADKATDDAEVVQVWGTAISSSSILTSDIELKQADHLSDLLRDQPGVDIGGTHSMNQGINIRGISELDLNITIDGASQTNNVFHHVGNLLINPDILQAVDIQVGNNSVLNGGLGGGIAFETKDAKDLLKKDEKFGARLSAGFASNDSYSYSGTAYSQLTDTIDVLAYYSGIERNNPEDGAGVEAVGQEGSTENYMVKFGWDANQANRLELSYDYYEDAGDYTLKSNLGNDFDHSNYIRPIEYTRETLTLNHELALGITDVHTSLYRNEMNYKNTNSDTNEVSEGNTIVYGLKAVAETSYELAGMYNTARYGVEGKQEEAQKLVNGQVSDDPNGNDGTESADSFALYAENEIELINGLFVTPGVRYNHYKIDIMASDDTFTDTIFALATKYELTDKWTVRASATELFKGPGLTGSYLTSGSTYNPDLKAETGINYEAAVAYQAQQVMGLDQLGFSFTVFETHIDDYINDTMTGKVSTYSNEGDVELVGYESEFNLRRGNLSARLSYSHSDSEFTKLNDNSSFALGQAIDDEVGDSIAFNLGYDIADLGLNMSWTSQLVFDLDKDVEADSAKEGYNVHDVSLRWVPTSVQELTITASVENIFDEHYSSHASHDFGVSDYEPGRNYKLTASYKF
ncbi:TonB-dependent receptor domain-containing protein [Shewanella youngdeokensis]|uniref:TonB-dependent receptor n=1 Tax=Shewanella youngdeokensis TaxID=2999068 RepID=A0ABZ0JVR0_9GAMM|nr:TonB-dependent receptor [Shewanella sp. DAU334]